PIYNSFTNGERPTAVLMHTSARVQWRRVHIDRMTVRSPADNHVPATFIGALFGPIHVVSVKDYLPHANGRRDNSIGGDRGFPRTVRRNLRSCHRLTPSSLFASQPRSG